MNECWLGQRTTRVHNARLIWERANGRPVPEGMWILHSCDNPPCANPAHLYPGTPSENARDAYRRGRKVPANQHTSRRRVALQHPTK